MAECSETYTAYANVILIERKKTSKTYTLLGPVRDNDLQKKRAPPQKEPSTRFFELTFQTILR